MKMNNRKRKLGILPELPIDLPARARTYARRKQISEGDLIELALEEFFISNIEEWAPALSTIGELSVLNYLELRSPDMAGGGDSLAKQEAKATVPKNRWNLPIDLHVRAVACADQLGIPYDEFLEIALRTCFSNPLMPASWHQALATLMTMALNDYLKERQPPCIAEADQTADAPRQH